jgi:hypothetical protein
VSILWFDVAVDELRYVGLKAFAACSVSRVYEETGVRTSRLRYHSDADHHHQTYVDRECEHAHPQSSVSSLFLSATVMHRSRGLFETSEDTFVLLVILHREMWEEGKIKSQDGGIYTLNPSPQTMLFLTPS